MKTLVVIGCLVISLAGCGVKEFDRILSSGGEEMKSASIQSLFVGSKAHMQGYGEEADLVFHANGKVSAENDNGDKNDGVWGTDGHDLLCLKFKRWGNGDKICYTVLKNNDQLSLFSKKLKRYDLVITDKNFEQASPITRQPLRQEQVIEVNEAQAISKTVSPGLLESPPPVLTPQAKKEIGLVVRDMAKNCPGCNLMKANLAGADLSYANLAGANLAEADLRHANLRRAQLQGANLYKADLTGADLEGAQLEGANVQGAVGFQ